jgi:formylglycine-generating enzyme required for sulfatase activity
MGSSDEDREARDNEKPRHQVQLTRGFWLFDTPCTQALWQAVMSKNPSFFKGEKRPVEWVSWDICQEFIAKVNDLLPGLRLQLPTEAQWEYACRAGTETSRYDEKLDVIAWYKRNSREQTHEVKQKLPNAWGVYDMLGNVAEWCHDGLRKYKAQLEVDPLGPTGENAVRAFRGGVWGWEAWDVRAAIRTHMLSGTNLDGIGFRCASSV